MSWVLVFIVIGSTQPSFVSGYQAKSDCEMAKAAVPSKAVKTAFCIPVGGTPK